MIRRYRKYDKLLYILVLSYILMVSVLMLVGCELQEQEVPEEEVTMSIAQEEKTLSRVSAATATEINDDIELYFNNPLLQTKPSTATTSDIGLALIQLIEQSEETIDFALYGLKGQPDIIIALARAMERGVVIRGVVDSDVYGSSYYSDTDVLVEMVGTVKNDYHTDLAKSKEDKNNKSNAYWPNPEGFNGPPQMVGYSLPEEKAIIAVHISKNPIEFSGNIMHNKFFVFDNKIVWTGSTNASDTGTGGYNANIACVINNEEIAELYEIEFEQMYTGGKFHTEKTVGSDKYIRLDDGTIIYSGFSPQDYVLRNEVVALINDAKQTIDLPVFYLTDKYITGALIKAHIRGVNIRVIIDASSASNGYTKHEILRAAGIPVKVENWGGKMHMKTMIVDTSTIVVGSMNFTTSGNSSNDENTLIISNDYYAKQGSDFFNLLWESIPDKYLTENPAPESKESINSLTDGIDNDFDGLIDGKDNPNPGEVKLPPYKIVKKEDGNDLIKGVTNKNGFDIYILPNDDYYDEYLVNEDGEGYYPSIREAKEDGFEAFDYDKHILMK